MEPIFAIQLLILPHQPAIIVGCNESLNAWPENSARALVELVEYIGLMDGKLPTNLPPTISLLKCGGHQPAHGTIYMANPTISGFPMLTVADEDTKRRFNIALQKGKEAHLRAIRNGLL